MQALRIRCSPIELRPVTPDAAYQLFRLARDPELSRLLAWKPHRTIDDSLTFIADARRLWERRTAFLPGIFDATSGELLGMTGVSNIDRANRRGEIGTWIGIPHQGRSLNRPAKAAVFALAFDVLGLHRLELLVRPDNDRSLTALRRLPGVHDEGLQHGRLWMHDHPHDAHMFAMTRDRFDTADWPAIDVQGALA